MSDIYDSAKRSEIMSRVKGTNTKPELLLRSLLHGAGYRFRLHAKELPGRPDILLPKYRTAIFLHGCFWHQHPGCKRATEPATRRKWWKAKLARNRDRDLGVERDLREIGWSSIVVWECELRDAEDVLRRVKTRLRDKRRMRSRNASRKMGKRIRIGVVDFFSGCGGASYGFANAGVPDIEIEIVAGIDIDPHSCATFENMLGAPAVNADIRALIRRPRALRELVAQWDLKRFDKVILIGCAPCQGFAAHRMSMNGKDGRRSLFVDFCEIVGSIKPDAVFMENVPDLFSRRHWPYYLRGRAILESSGYTVRADVYNFAGFGLPQERFRAVVAAVPHAFELPEPRLAPASFRTVRQSIGHLPPLRAGEAWAGDPMHIVSKHRPETVALLAQVPKDGGNRPIGAGPECLDRTRKKHGGYTDVYGRLAWDRPAVTITSRCRTPSCGRFAHPEQNRGLSVREAALLQGFPDDFMFEGPFDDKYKQIGNAVPPLVAQVFAEHLVRVLQLGPLSNVGGASRASIERPIGPGFAVTINGLKRKRTSGHK